MSESHGGTNITTGTSKNVTVTGRARRGLILAVAVASTLAATLLSATPAHAGGYKCTLRYYQNQDGSPYWPATQVNDPSQYPADCALAPAIARFNGGTIIADSFQTIVGSLTTWVNIDGLSWLWSRSDARGNFLLAVGPPAVIPYSGGTEIAVTLSHQLAYLWEPVGSTMQGPEIPASSGISQNAPAIARTSGATEIAATGTDNSLRFYWNFDGTSNWGSNQIVGPGLAYGAPAIVADDYSTEVAYMAPDASLWFDWIINGTTTWHREEVAGPGTVWGEGVAMTHSYGGIQIAGQGYTPGIPGGSLMFFWAADGTTTWHPEQVAGPGTMQGAPAMVAGNYTMQIAVTAPDGSLHYYWSNDGTPTWYGAQIAPPGTASTSPAMTRSNGGTEIAVAGP